MKGLRYGRALSFLESRQPDASTLELKIMSLYRFLLMAVIAAAVDSVALLHAESQGFYADSTCPVATLSNATEATLSSFSTAPLPWVAMVGAMALLTTGLLCQYKSARRGRSLRESFRSWKIKGPRHAVVLLGGVLAMAVGRAEGQTSVVASNLDRLVFGFPFVYGSAGITEDAWVAAPFVTDNHFYRLEAAVLTLVDSDQLAAGLEAWIYTTDGLGFPDSRLGSLAVPDILPSGSAADVTLTSISTILLDPNERYMVVLGGTDASIWTTWARTAIAGSSLGTGSLPFEEFFSNDHGGSWQMGEDSRTLMREIRVSSSAVPEP